MLIGWYISYLRMLIDHADWWVNCLLENAD